MPIPCQVCWTVLPDSPSVDARRLRIWGSTASTTSRRVISSGGRARQYPPDFPRRLSIRPALRRSLKIWTRKLRGMASRRAISSSGVMEILSYAFASCASALHAYSSFWEIFICRQNEKRGSWMGSAVLKRNRRRFGGVRNLLAWEVWRTRVNRLWSDSRVLIHGPANDNRCMVGTLAGHIAGARAGWLTGGITWRCMGLILVMLRHPVMMIQGFFSEQGQGLATAADFSSAARAEGDRSSSPKTRVTRPWGSTTIVRRLCWMTPRSSQKLRPL